MAGNFKMPNKKATIIACVIIAILAIIAITGTVAFLKDRGRTEAAELNSEQVLKEEEKTSTNIQNEQDPQSITTEDNGEVAGNSDIQDEQNSEITENNEEVTENGNRQNVETANNNQSSNGVAGTATSTEDNGTATTDNIQGTTITRTEQVEIPERQISEAHYVGWSPMQIEANIASANIVAEKQEIEVTKKADEKVAQGDEVTYQITVTNKTSEDMKNIDVKDRLDSTILDTSTVVFVVEEKNINNLITIPGTVVENTIIWNIDIKAGETVTIMFKATVKTNVEEGTILKNTVVANGVELEKPTETEITKATKNITIEKNWRNDEEVVEYVRPSNLIINLENSIEVELTKNNETNEDTNIWSKEIEVDKYDNEGNEIIYGYLNETSTDTNKFSNYTQKSVEQTEEQDKIIVINEYNEPEVTNTEIEKDGTDVITSKEQEVEYTINYKTTINYYKGDATVTIVDTLPYEIDTNNAKIKLDGGNYKAETKTIIWTEKITGIDTYANGEKEINISKTIKVVYKNMNVMDGKFVNKAEGQIKLDEINKEIPTDPTEKETEQNFKKDITVIKEWIGDTEQVRPSDITINLENNQSARMTSENAVKEKTNIWTKKITVDKYNADGTEKTYKYISETTTDANINKFANYTQSVDERTTDVVKVTNTYKAPEVTTNTITKTGTDKITEKDGVVTYQIKYNATIKDYKGDAVVTIVDTLPYEIDANNKNIELNGGKYNAQTKTITWTENVSGIDTFANGSKPKEIEIIKNITVVYKDINVKAKNFENKVNATLKLNTNNEEYGPVEDKKITEIDFTKDLTIIKVWAGDKESVRPSDITINLNNNKYATLTNKNKIDENTWKTTINVEKYDEKGTIIDYDYISESSTQTDKLLNYTVSNSKNGDTITVTNTYKAPNTTVNKVEKKGTEKITSKDEVVQYTINYTATIKDYKGTAVVTVIDQLPYEIDTDKEYNLNGGVYNKDNKTITWTEPISGIDTFSKQNKEQTISFSKTISVIFKNMNVTVSSFTNKVTASLKLNETDPIPANPDEHTTTQEFKKDITVEKIWNRDSTSVRPSNLTINLSNGKTITLTSENEKDSRTWSGVIKGVDKYDATTGNEITYTFVNETSTDEKFNDYTKGNVDETVKDTIKVTNNYKTTNLNGTKIWDDKGDLNKNRPESIQVALKKIVNGKNEAVLDGERKEIVLTVNKQENTDGTIKNEWTYIFNNLPIFDENGNAIQYTVEELNVKSGYVATVEGMNITNKYEVNLLEADKTIVGVKPVTSETGKFVSVVPTEYKVTEGDEIKYKIEVTNTGNTDLTEIVIKDNKKVTLESIEVPSGMNKENVELKEYTANTNIVENLTGTLKVNEKITLYVILKVEKGLIINTENLTNTVEASAKNTPKDDGEATIGVTGNPSAKIEKTSILVNGKTFDKTTTKLKKGDIVTYELKVTNTGNVTLEHINITDDRKVTYNNKTYNVDEKILGTNGITLEPDGVYTINVTYTVTQDDLDNQNTQKTLINWATVIVTEDGKDVVYDKDNDVLTEIEATPNLVNKTKSIKVNGVNSQTGAVVELGDLITYTISVTNNGTKKATEVKIEDYVPTGTEFKSAEGNPTVETRADGKQWRIWTVDVPAGETVSVSFTVKVKNIALGTTILNTGKVNNIDTNTITNTTKTELNIYQVDSIGQGQKAVVVIDMSLSMASAVNPDINSDTMAYAYTDTRWYHLKTALDSFITDFLANGRNEIAIVGYNENATQLIGYTNNATTAKNSYANVFTQTHFDNLQAAASFGKHIYDAQMEGSFSTPLSIENGKYVIDVDALTYLSDGKWNKNASSVDARVQKDTLITGATATTVCSLASGTNIAAGLVTANTVLGNKEVTYTSVILMTDGENNRNVEGTTIANEAYKINKIKKANLYTIGFTNDVKTLTDKVGTSNITKSFTATTSSKLYEAFDELKDKLTELPAVTKTTDQTGKVDLSDYARLNLQTVVFYKGETATEANILKTYTGTEFKNLLMSGKFDLAAFINSDEVKGKLTESDTINVEIVVKK